MGLKVSQSLAGTPKSSKPPAAITQHILQAGQTVYQRLPDRVGVHGSFSAAIEVPSHSRDWNIGVRAPCRHQLDLSTFKEMCGCCDLHGTPLSVCREEIHGKPSAKYSPVRLLGVLPCYKRWPVQTLCPPLLGVHIRILIDRGNDQQILKHNRKQHDGINETRESEFGAACLAMCREARKMSGMRKVSWAFG